MNPAERDAAATQFGVASEQVERDHLISHLLAFLSAQFDDRIHFIGGTAPARTHLPDGRLSEDIYFIAIRDRKDVARDLDNAPPRGVTRTHSRLTVEPLLTTTPPTRFRCYCAPQTDVQCACSCSRPGPHRLAHRARPLGPVGAGQHRRDRTRRCRVVRAFGPTNRDPGPYLFRNVPADSDWQAQLTGQTRLSVSAEEALDAVRTASQRAVRPAGPHKR